MCIVHIHHIRRVPCPTCQRWPAAAVAGRRRGSPGTPQPRTGRPPGAPCRRAAPDSCPAAPPSPSAGRRPTGAATDPAAAACPAQTGPSPTPPEHREVGQVRSGQVRSGKIRAGQGTAGRVGSGQVRSGRVRAEQATPGGNQSGTLSRLHRESTLLMFNVLNRHV